jgi:tetratricopeptide (TPR) repeat protein
MKARTAKRIAILILVLSLVGGAGFFTQRYQVDRLARKELEKAELACMEGDFAKAEALFRAHVQVFPEDLEIQIKRADALLRVSRSRVAQNEANQIYSEILKRFGGREDVRRSLIQLKFDMGSLVSSNGRENGADVDLKILLDTQGNQNDPHLLYLMGRCDEARGDDAIAVKNAIQNYRRVVENKDALDRIDAGARLATLLLHAKPSQPEEARAVINKLVE